MIRLNGQWEIQQPTKELQNIIHKYCPNFDSLRDGFPPLLDAPDCVPTSLAPPNIAHTEAILDSFIEVRALIDSDDEPTVSAKGGAPNLEPNIIPWGTIQSGNERLI